VYCYQGRVGSSNTLANALYRVFCAGPGAAHKEMRQARARGTRAHARPRPMMSQGGARSQCTLAVQSREDLARVLARVCACDTTPCVQQRLVSVCRPPAPSSVVNLLRMGRCAVEAVVWRP